MEIYQSPLENVGMKMKMGLGKKVLITGGTGLVGSHLVEKLLFEKFEISVLLQDVHKDSLLIKSGAIDHVNLIYGDLRNFNVVARAVVESECSRIFHLGAQTLVGPAFRNPLSTFESNIQGTWNLLEAVRLYSKEISSIVVASSDKAYGASDQLPYFENHPLKGSGPYDVSKSCTDLIAQSYAATYGLPVRIARCGNIYGAGDTNWSRIVPGTFRDLYRGVTPKLRSDGTYLRDYIYVEDVVESYMILSERESLEPGAAFNFSQDKAYTVLEIYSEVCKAAVGKWVEPVFTNTVTAEIHDQHLSSSKAKLELGWEARFDLQFGLEITAEWYREVSRKEIDVE
jgi:CDP-glucose 4,6-dehydratase